MARVLTIIMAGGMGDRLQPLTRERSKAAVPFGGKFRLIDFTLSNCVNSGLRNIYVLTQYRSESLNTHIQDGWGISSSGLGDFIYSVPAQQKLDAEWYKGTADAVRQNINLIDESDADDILILAGDHVYKMNYLQMLTFHRRKKAALTVSAVRERKERAAGVLGVLEVDNDYRLIGFEEKPARPKTLPNDPDFALASMGIYVFSVNTLLNVLKSKGDDFGNNIIPRMVKQHQDVYVYDFEKENRIEDFQVQVIDGIREKVPVEVTTDSPYWKDVGTLDSYYEASMDLVGVHPAFNLYGEKWTLRTCQRPLPPSKCVLGGKALESIMCDGCIISGGTVWNSILSPGVVVERGAEVEQSVVFDDVIIDPGARVRRAIIDKQCRIRGSARIGFDFNLDRNRGCTISDNGIIVIPKGTEIT